MCAHHEVLEQVYCKYFPKTLADSTESTTEQLHTGLVKRIYMDLWSVSDQHTNEIMWTIHIAALAWAQHVVKPPVSQAQSVDSSIFIYIAWHGKSKQNILLPLRKSFFFSNVCIVSSSGVEVFIALDNAHIVAKTVHNFQAHKRKNPHST